MSVMLELNIGDLVIDLHDRFVPRMTENFIKLCKIKYYNFAPVYNIQHNFTCQSGDPIGPTGDGGWSAAGLLMGRRLESRFLPAEIHKKLSHAERGTVSMAVTGANADGEGGLVASQFFITLADGLDYLDGKHAVFGQVVEGFDTLEKINAAFCDESGMPLRDIRILHAYVLEDPFPDPPGLEVPPMSPPPTKEQLATVRVAEGEEDQDAGLTEEEIARKKRAAEARAQALTLEMVGDLPFAEVAPPENVLFVCKLNSATQDEDLRQIFSRFGEILSCEIIRDKRTGDSLQYAFIEFAKREDSERAFYKMQRVIIDESRIHVDFSQSVSKTFQSWRNQRLRRGREDRRRDSDGWDGGHRQSRSQSQSPKRDRRSPRRDDRRSMDNGEYARSNCDDNSRDRNHGVRGGDRYGYRDGDRYGDRDGDRYGDRDYGDRSRGRDRDRSRDRARYRDHDRGRNRDHDRGRDGDRERDRHRVRDRGRDRSRDEVRNRYRDESRNRYRDRADDEGRDLGKRDDREDKSRSADTGGSWNDAARERGDDRRQHDR